MKKLYTFFATLILAVGASAQLQTEVVSNGVFKLTYGASNDYSIYDPGFQTPTFYVHCWVNAADNTSGANYSDSWANSDVTMNWDADAGAYVGTIDLNTKTFTQTNNKIPGGTTVDKMGIVFKDQQNGATRQSADLTVNGPTTILTLAVQQTDAAKRAAVVNGKLYTSLKGSLQISIYEMSGKLVKKFSAVAGTPIDLQVKNPGTFLVKIEGAGQTETVRFLH